MVLYIDDPGLTFEEQNRRWGLETIFETAYLTSYLLMWVRMMLECPIRETVMR